MVYKCATCGIENTNALVELSEKSRQASEEAKQLAAQIDFKVKLSL